MTIVATIAAVWGFGLDARDVGILGALSRLPAEPVMTGDYQPAERKYRLTRQMLEICLELGFPVFILSRSPLVLRDLDLPDLATSGVTWPVEQSWDGRPVMLSAEVVNAGGGPALVPFRVRFLGAAREALCAEAWEDLCRSCVAGLAGGESPLAKLGPWVPAGRYWSAGEPEWDVVAGSVDGRRLLLGEVKWSDRPVTVKEVAGIASELNAKGMPAALKHRVEAFHAVFVPKAEEGAKAAIPEGCLVVEAGEILGVLR